MHLPKTNPSLLKSKHAVRPTNDIYGSLCSSLSLRNNQLSLTTANVNNSSGANNIFKTIVFICQLIAFIPCVIKGKNQVNLVKVQTKK